MNALRREKLGDHFLRHAPLAALRLDHGPRGLEGARRCQMLTLDVVIAIAQRPMLRNAEVRSEVMPSTRDARKSGPAFRDRHESTRPITPLGVS